MEQEMEEKIALAMDKGYQQGTDDAVYLQLS